MQALRRATFLARLVLAWFALTLGVAIAAPLVQPGELQIVCSGGAGVKLVQPGDGDDAQPIAAMDCPLCASLAAPPPARRGVAVLPLAGLPQAQGVAQPWAAPPSGLPPARGPPPSIRL
jgi:hypothetical protein